MADQTFILSLDLQLCVGQMFTMNLLDKAKEFREGFEDLQDNCFQASQRKLFCDT